MLEQVTEGASSKPKKEKKKHKPKENLKTEKKSKTRKSKSENSLNEKAVIKVNFMRFCSYYFRGGCTQQTFLLVLSGFIRFCFLCMFVLKFSYA